MTFAALTAVDLGFANIERRDGLGFFEFLQRNRRTVPDRDPTSNAWQKRVTSHVRGLPNLI